MTETASKGGLDPTVEAIGVVQTICIVPYGLSTD